MPLFLEIAFGIILAPIIFVIGLFLLALLLRVFVEIASPVIEFLNEPHKPDPEINKKTVEFFDKLFEKTSSVKKYISERIFKWFFWSVIVSAFISVTAAIIAVNLDGLNM